MTRDEIANVIQSIDLMSTQGRHCTEVKVAAFNASTALKALEIEMIKQDLRVGEMAISRLAQEIKRRETQ